jgi:hypothetical protein
VRSFGHKNYKIQLCHDPWTTAYLPVKAEMLSTEVWSLKSGYTRTIAQADTWWRRWLRVVINLRPLAPKLSALANCYMQRSGWEYRLCRLKKRRGPPHPRALV